MPEAAYESQLEIVKAISHHLQVVYKQVHELVEARKIVNNITNSRTKAIGYESQIKGKFFEEIRYHVDKLEQLVSDEEWTLPKYREMLFLR